MHFLSYTKGLYPTIVDQEVGMPFGRNRYRFPKTLLGIFSRCLYEGTAIDLGVFKYAS